MIRFSFQEFLVQGWSKDNGKKNIDILTYAKILFHIRFFRIYPRNLFDFPGGNSRAEPVCFCRFLSHTFPQKTDFHMQNAALKVMTVHEFLRSSESLREVV